MDDRTVHNIFETLNTWLRTQNIFIGGAILAHDAESEEAQKHANNSSLALYA